MQWVVADSLDHMQLLIRGYKEVSRVEADGIVWVCMKREVSNNAST
jgi:hypothetical protein